MTALGFQLYSLHAVEDPLPAVIERVGAAGFEGVEFAGLGEASVEEIETAVDDAGIRAAGAHVGLDEIEDDPAAVAETYGALDCSTVVVPWLDPEHFADAASARAAGDRLSAAADALASHGVDLHYHNHDQEFVDLDGDPALDALFDAANGVGLELDLGWCGAAGYDPLDYFERHADRIDLVHCKDYDAAAGEPVAIGDGDLDLDAAIDAVESRDVDWFVFEAETSPDSYETLDRAASALADDW